MSKFLKKVFKQIRREDLVGDLEEYRDAYDENADNLLQFYIEHITHDRDFAKTVNLIETTLMQHVHSGKIQKQNVLSVLVALKNRNNQQDYKEDTDDEIVEHTTDIIQDETKDMIS